MASPLDPPPPALPPKKKDPKKSPQELVGDFWTKFFTKKPGKVTSIFPRSLYAGLLPPLQPRGAYLSRNAAESYEAAAKECRERVRRIQRECNRTNERFTDPDFDIEADENNNCLNGLVRDDFPWAEETPEDSTAVSTGALRNSLDTLAASQVLPQGAAVPVDISAMSKFISDSYGIFGNASATQTSNTNKRAPSDPKKTASAKRPRAKGRGVEAGAWFSPGSIHRIDWIFDSPQFTVDGFSSSDIRQGGDGDCWWLAAVATIAHRKDLMAKVCVARDEECGVYGFVFHRDGDWVSVVVDDNLYLKSEDFDFYGDIYDSTGKRAREYRKRYQTGSEALYFAKCEDPNETWLPLLEKAYAKFHGDYEAISGGWSGEGVEDMTGGVTTTIATNRVFRKDRLWKELVNAEGNFVFALSALGTGWDYQRSGLALGHAYSILKATEEVDEDGNKVRLVQVRNPWGQRSWNGLGEWNGPWSDGSKEWTAYWLKKLNHKFGDDGVFWMSYQSMLDTFMFMHRTRLFDEKWTIVQQWTSVNVGWVSGYLQRKFIVHLKKASLVVFVLTQLDERFFVGLEGQYEFSLHFLLQQEGAKQSEHLCRVRPVHDWENRSVSCEVELEPGTYEVLPKITATRNDKSKMVEDVVKEYAEKNPQKLRQIGMHYDLAHAKGGVLDEDDELQKKKAEDKKKEEEKKKKKAERKRRRKEKAKAERKKAKAEARKAEAEAKKAEEEARKAEEAGKKQAEEDAKKQAEEAAKSGAEGGKAPQSAQPAEAKASPAPPTAAAGTSAVGTASDSKPLEAPGANDFEMVSAKEARASVAEAAPASKSLAPPGSDANTAGSVGGPLPERTVEPDGKKKDEKEKKKGDEKDKKKDGDKDKKKDDDEDDDLDDDDADDDSDSESEDSSTENEDATPPWNAVIVMGLRVYAMDPDVSITLVVPKDAEEASSLTVDEKTSAGATM